MPDRVKAALNDLPDYVKAILRDTQNRANDNSQSLGLAISIYLNIIIAVIIT